MIHFVTVSIWCMWIATTNGLKIASYNTYQVFTNAIADKLVPGQLSEISTSDADIMCLQELFSPDKAKIYSQSLSTVYPYSFSALNIRSSDDFTKPRTPCTTEEIAAFTDCASCAGVYPAETFPACMATFCPDAYAKVRLSECAWCFVFAPQILSTGDMQTVGAFCGNEVNLPFLLNQTDGTMIISKLPIVNTWSLPLPAWLVLDKRVNIAQINVCSERPPFGEQAQGAESCTDSVIVACIHLNPTGYTDPVSTFVPADKAQRDAGISSHIELNEYQIEYLLDNVLRDDVAPWDTNDNNILGVFITGDFNTGQNWPRGHDNFELFEYRGYTEFGDNLCTVCLDPYDEYFNVLDLDESGTWITDENSSRALDHVMIREEDLENFKTVKCDKDFERLFLNKYNISNRIIPLSDHWGVQLQLKVHDKAKPRTVQLAEAMIPRFIPYSDGIDNDVGFKHRPGFIPYSDGIDNDVRFKHRPQEGIYYLAVNILVSMVCTLCVIAVCFTAYYFMQKKANRGPVSWAKVEDTDV